ARVPASAWRRAQEAARAWRRARASAQASPARWHSLRAESRTRPAWRLQISRGSSLSFLVCRAAPNLIIAYTPNTSVFREKTDGCMIKRGGEADRKCRQGTAPDRARVADA